MNDFFPLIHTKQIESLQEFLMFYLVLFTIITKCFLCRLGQFIPYSLEVSSTIQASQVSQIIEFKTDSRHQVVNCNIIFHKYCLDPVSKSWLKTL